MTTMTTAQESAHLTARADIAPGTLCDRCRMAPAKTRLTHWTGSVLYLCAHHYGQHELRLETDVAFTIHTEPNVCNCYQCTPVSERPEV